MRSVLIRLPALAAGIALVASCDTRMPTQATIGGGGSSSSAKDAGAPTIALDTPIANTLINVGDSILVVMRVHDDKALSSLSVDGLSYRGNEDLGTLVQRVRYALVSVPVSGLFRPGLRDTTIRRYLKPVSAADTSLDSLVIVAIVKDSSGNADTTKRRVDLVLGPKVTILSPTASDSVPAGVGLGITAKAVHGDGIAQISVRVQA